MAGRTTRLAAGGTLLVGSVATGLAAAPPTAGALGVTLTVDSLTDGPSDPTHCTDLTAGNCSLRDAIAASNYLAGRDTITFDPSLSGSIVLSSSLDQLTDSVTVTGPGADVLTIDGSRQFSGFSQFPDQDPVTDEFAPIDLEVTGLTLTGMSSTNLFQSSAITLLSGNLTVRNTVVTDSGRNAPGNGYLGAPISAGLWNGGYQFVNNVDRTAILENVVVTDNHSVEGGQQIVSNAGSIAIFAGHVVISGCEISNNSSDMLAGPLLWGRDIEVSNTEISGNRSRQMYSGLAVVAERASITGSVIAHNDAFNFSGLLVYGPDLQTADAHLSISDSIISDNHAVYGSTVSLQTWNNSLDRVSVVNNVVDDTTIAPTAAVLLYGNSTITSSTISNNSGTGVTVAPMPITPPTSISALDLGARRLGGRRAPASNALYTGTVVVSHSTIADNSGVGVSVHSDTEVPHSAGDIVFDHTIVAGNGGATGSDVDVAFTSRFSLIQRTSVTPVEGPGGGNLLGVDPQLQPLSRFSPLTAVRPILFGSPAWNVGDPNFVPPPATDQRGAPRVVDIVDMGAFEVQEELVLPRFTG